MANCKWLLQMETPFVTFFFNKYCSVLSQLPPPNLSIKIYSSSWAPLSFCSFFVPLQMLKQLFLEWSEHSLYCTHTEHSETWLSKICILLRSVVCAPSLLPRHHHILYEPVFSFKVPTLYILGFCSGVFATLKPFCVYNRDWPVKIYLSHGNQLQ